MLLGDKCHKQEFCLTEIKTKPCSAHLLKDNIALEKKSSCCEILQRTNLTVLAASSLLFSSFNSVRYENQILITLFLRHPSVM